LLSIEWPPESVGPLHTHPGDEYGIVIKGVYAIRELNGQWKTYTAGEGFHLLIPLDPMTSALSSKGRSRLYLIRLRQRVIRLLPHFIQVRDESLLPRLLMKKRIVW
jgi:hypothetical protein